MSVRSYVLRQGRLTKAQALALERHWPQFGIDYRAEPLDLDRVFNRRAPRILDIGAGAGEATLELALRHPENDYLAVEVHSPGVGRLLRGIVRHELTNIRVIRHDVVDVVNHQLAAESLSAIYLHFPDPWPKKRHHKRRLVTSGFVGKLASRMSFEALLFLATDSRDFAEHAIAVCDGAEALINLAGPGNFSPRPEWRPLTKFEQRGLSRGHDIWNLIYCRRFG